MQRGFPGFKSTPKIARVVELEMSCGDPVLTVGAADLGICRALVRTQLGLPTKFRVYHYPQAGLLRVFDVVSLPYVSRSC
jgi:hypothetical protein